MLLGTHTSEEEQNHLLLAEVHLPTEDSELSSAQYDEEQSETGGYGASPGADHDFVIWKMPSTLLTHGFYHVTAATMQPCCGHAALHSLASPKVSMWNLPLCIVLKM